MKIYLLFLILPTLSFAQNSINEKATEKEQDKILVWKSGLMGRFGLVYSQIDAKVNNEKEDRAPFGNLGNSQGAFWDIIEYRSANWWSIGLSLSSVYDTAKTEIDTYNRWYTMSGLKFGYDFLKTDILQRFPAKLQAGVILGVAILDVEKKKPSEYKIEGSGSSNGLSLLYDVLFYKHFGATISVQYASSKIHEFETKEVTINKDTEITTNTYSLLVGMIYNFDLD